MLPEQDQLLMPFDINSKIDAWRTLLLDTSKRNRLINFKVGRTGGIALAHPDPGDIWARLVTANAGLTFAWKRELIDLPPEPEEAASDVLPVNQAEASGAKDSQDVLARCRCSPHLRPEHLLTELPDQQLAGRLTRLALNSRESLAEQGVATLYIAFGILRWFESADSSVEIRSPLLLVPVRLERENIEAPWRVQAEDEDVLTNHSLAHLLANEFRLHLPDVEDELPDGEGNWRTRYFGAVQRCVRHQPRWEVLDEVALGTFSFQKLAMWDDLDRNRDRLAAHDLCRAVAGDPGVQLRCPADLPQAKELDRHAHPRTVFHILDADSSQHEAITAATRGANLVLDGPPGTGKSQTITNIIAEFLAVGKTVLFVSEKAAALEVVQRNLEKKGLGDFCLACHSHKGNKRDVVSELGRCLGLGSESYPDRAEDLQRLHDVRRQLNDYVRELHAPRPPLGMTVHQVQGELARLARLTGKSRCPVSRVLERDAAYLPRVQDLLARLPDCRGVLADREKHPWRGCRATVYSPTLRDDIRHHFGRLAACLTTLTEATATLHGLGFCAAMPTLSQWRAAVSTARTVLACPEVPADWFEGEPRPIVEAVIKIDRLSQAYQRTLATLPEFAKETLRVAGTDALTLMARSPGEPRLLPQSGETLKTLCQRLGPFSSSLQELHRRALALDQRVQAIGQLLRMPLSPLVKAIPSLAKIADLIGRLGPVRQSWWDAERRKELQSAIAQCQEQARVAREARTQLGTRLSPQAFLPENAAVVARASGFRSFLARLMPRWWSLKSEVTNWYIGEAPKTAALLEDLQKLAAYHRRLDYCRQVQEQYSGDLVAGRDGEPDWDRTLEDLRILDRLEAFIKRSAALQASLSREGGLNRAALATASRALAAEEKALRRHLETVARQYDLAEVTDGTPGQVRLTPQNLVAWLEAQITAVSRHADLLGRVSGLLAEGRDLRSDQLPARLRGLAELAKLRDQVAVLCRRVWPGQPFPKGAEEYDWAPLRSGANALLGLLDRCQAPLPTPVIQILTSPDVRARLTEAVQQIDAVCAGGFEESCHFLAGLFDPTQSISTGITVEATALDDLRAWLAQRVEDVDRIHEWTQFCEVEREVARENVPVILQEVLAGQLTPQDAGEAFRARFLALWLDAIFEQVPALLHFSTEKHERLIERFRDLDRSAVAAAASRIRSFQLSRPDRPRAVAAEAPGSSELGILLREANKKRRHLPLRKLFAVIPNVLLRLKPCVMMSPLAVSTYLGSSDIGFDLVIFDEASQVRPHDAIAAIARGRQLVVAGDQKQLPPTSFFDRVLEDEGVSDEDEGGGLQDYESILDVCCTLGLLRRRLRWHYRSKREGLIAFSNQFIYGNELVTFPSVEDMAGNPPVTLKYVSNGRWKAGSSGGFNAVEARTTAQLVLEHFRQYPDESLGVIAFSQRQQRRIEDELEILRKANRDLDEFFHEDREEPFFVKNLENVQGDEREVIFLAVGYGPDEVTERVLMRFGPLNQQGGERRLNVAVTRARLRVLVISSMHAHDIDLNRTDALGVKLLRAYLDYAERGPESLGAAITAVGEHGFESPFEQDVYEELTRRGLTVHPQVGCARFRIDLALVDPRRPGRYLLGLECDGATYHSSATARDRDRLRQDVLERLGWRICRVWSTDWLRDRETQVRRVQTALERAQREKSAEREEPPPVARTQPPTQEAPSAGQPTEEEATAAPPSGPGPSYKSIDDVPEFVLREVLTRLLRTFGATEANELIQAVARQLGFKRTGKRIQTRINQALEGLIQAGQVCRTDDQRVESAPRAASM
jgi:very-short-patch-repair endonuclease